MLTKLEWAKSKIALHASFFISLTSKLQFVPDESIPTAATDGRRVYYNAPWFDTLPLKQVIGVVLHEVMHNMLSHPSRVGDRNKYVANLAMDIIGNQLLLKYFEETRQTLDAELPPGGLFGPEWDKYQGKNWEYVYAELMKQAKQQSGKGQGKDGNGPPTPGQGGLPQQFDEVRQAAGEDGKPMTPQQAEELAKEWAMAAQQAATMAKARGKLPGMLEEFVADMVAPKVDWRSQVWDAFTKVAKEEQSWRRFNRRYMHSGSYLPGRYSEHLGLVVFAVDTSGSMGSEEFKLAMGALNDVFEDLRPEQINFVQCDTRICSDEMLTPDDVPLTPRQFKGRGGTELTPIFQHVQQLDGDEPDLVVCLTDGYFGAIDHALEPGCPVLWLVTTNSTQAAEESFGRVIRVEA